VIELLKPEKSGPTLQIRGLASAESLIPVCNSAPTANAPLTGTPASAFHPPAAPTMKSVDTAKVPSPQTGKGTTK